MQVQLRIQSLRPRDSRDDESVGVQLVAAVQRAAAKGPPAPAAVTVRDERIDIFLGQEVARAAVPMDFFLAGLTRSDAPGGDLSCVGLIGTLTHRGTSVQQATVYLEWSDCRWWLWRALIDADGHIREDTATVLRALDGDTKPLPIGGWWSFGRRNGIAATLDTHEARVVH